MPPSGIDADTLVVNELKGVHIARGDNDIRLAFCFQFVCDSAEEGHLPQNLPVRIWEWKKRQTLFVILIAARQRIIGFYTASPL